MKELLKLFKSGVLDLNNYKLHEGCNSDAITQNFDFISVDDLNGNWEFQTINGRRLVDCSDIENNPELSGKSFVKLNLEIKFDPAGYDGFDLCTMIDEAGNTSILTYITLNLDTIELDNGVHFEILKFNSKTHDLKLKLLTAPARLNMPANVIYWLKRRAK